MRRCSRSAFATRRRRWPLLPRDEVREAGDDLDVAHLGNLSALDEQEALPAVVHRPTSIVDAKTGERGGHDLLRRSGREARPGVDVDGVQRPRLILIDE